jgi:hypothetical protein
MNADSYFEIGHSHKICEDYTLSGVCEDLAYAIVSDGCSASKDSDVGARLLAHISRDAILYLYKRKLLYDFVFLSSAFKTTFEEIIIKKCLEVRDTLRLSYNIFDATLLIAIGINGQKIMFSWGDGYFITKRPSGNIDVIMLTFESNAPYYLSYEMSTEKHEGYKEVYTSQPLIKKLLRIHKDNSITLLDTEIITNVMQRSYYHVSNSETDQLIVASDGLGTFEEDPSKCAGLAPRKYSALEIISQIVAYKNPVGEFVTRRMNKFKKDNESLNVIHQDDLSCSAINFI